MAGRGKTKRRSPSDKYERDWMRLQDSLANRYSRYIAGVGDLIQRRSLEPKEWLSGYAGLWRDVIGDVGDWMLARAGEPLRPTDEWAQRSRTRIPKMQKSVSISIEVPMKAFGRTHETITLVTDGLSRGNRQIILHPDDNVCIEPKEVKKSDRRSVKVRLFDLERLEAGIYSGIVCARETDFTVAIIELEVR